jgi:hypothetical protein
MTRPRSRRRAGLALAALAAAVLGIVGCAATRVAYVDPGRVDEGLAALSEPLPGDLAALYSVKAGRSVGPRLAVLTAGDAGRMTVSEPFGSAVSITAWSAGAEPVLLDLDAGCSRSGSDLRAVLGVRALPLDRAVRLLGGRLPAQPRDGVVVGAGAEIEITGVGWAAAARIAQDPWRVVKVVERGAGDGAGWRIELRDHQGSVPGRVRLTNVDGRWVELRLKRIEWPAGASLPELPTLPPCGPS